MNKIKFIGLSLCLSYQAFAQQAPTISNPPNQGENSADFWSRAGNTNTNGINNIFGTKWNSPIYTITNGLTGTSYRSKMNGDFTSPLNQYSINNYTFGITPTTVNTSGYMLLGYNTPLQTNLTQYIYNNKGAFSLLHLNGQASATQELGYRPWMKTGITFTGNRDLSYMGLRQVGLGEDNTETVIAWSDNTTGITDEMCFRFTGAAANTAVNLETTTLSPDDLDGLHIARFHPNGRFGLGSTFGNTDVINTPNYISPQSLFHMSYPHRVNSGGNVYEPYGFMQLTYRSIIANNPLKVGLGEKLTDGLRFGIDNDIQNASSAGNFRHLNGYLRWQEGSSFIIQTDSDTTSGGIETSERLRITSLGAVKLNQGITGASTAIADENITRIGISHDGNLPVTKPMSLLHIGYNTGNTFSQLVNQPYPIGWRKWMDLGMFVSNRQNHVFLGLKPEGNGTINNNPRMDAVLSWGEKSEKINGVQEPDIFRFIFTGDALDTGENPYTKSEIGEEMFRIYPAKDSIFSYQGLATSYTNLDTVYGRVGIGNFSINGVNEQPTHKLDVIGNGRFRFLPDDLYKADGEVKKIVMVDTNGVLRWTDNISSNGFAACSSTGGQLVDDSKVNLNDKNFYFSDNFTIYNPNFNRVAVGYQCSEILPAKFNAKLDHLSDIKTTVGYFENSDMASNSAPVGTTFTAIQGKVSQIQSTSAPSTIHVAARLDASGATRENNGVIAVARGGSQSTGGRFSGNNAPKNFGVTGSAGAVIMPFSNNNFGGFFGASGSTINYGIYGKAVGSSDYAGYFNGNLHYTGTLNGVSDEMFKHGVAPDKGALKTLQKLQPKTYLMRTHEFPQFGFSDVRQHGFIAQEVQDVLPELVNDNHHPGEIDSLGNVISEPVNYKSLNYIGLISINTQAILELNQIVEKQTLSDQNLKTNVEDLTGSLDKIKLMRGVSYDWDNNNHPEMGLDSVNHVGFLAQEINAIDERLTFVDDNNFMHVDYDKMIPIVVEGMGELNNKMEVKDSIINSLQTITTTQQAEISSLNERLAVLESCLANYIQAHCKGNKSIETNSEEEQKEMRSKMEVILTDRNTLILTQNVPNPFAEKTVIEYSVPANVGKAQIHFYNAEGKIINSVEIIERGEGELTVFANDLSSGIYTYTLVADGKIVATKKMMKN